MKMYKRILALVLAVGMVVTMLPDTTYAALSTVQDTDQMGEAVSTENENIDTEAMTETESKTEKAASTEKVIKKQVLEDDAIADMPEQDSEVASTGDVELDYTLLEPGVSVEANVENSSSFVFKPKTSGIYHLNVACDSYLEVSAYYQYYYKQDGSEEITTSEFQSFNGYDYGKNIDRVMYLDADESYKFKISYDDMDEAQEVSFTIKMSNPLTVNNLSVVSNPTNKIYDSIDFTGTELQLEVQDTVTEETYQIDSGAQESGVGYMVITLFKWFDLSYSDEMSAYSSVTEDGIISIDGDTSNTDVSKLNDGTHQITFKFGINQYDEEQYTNSVVADLNFTLDVEVERNAIESIEVINDPRDTYYAQWGQCLDDYKIRVNYKDARPSIEVEADGYLELLSTNEDGYEVLQHYDGIDDYLNAGGKIGTAKVMITYRGVSITDDISIEETPYDRIEVDTSSSRNTYYGGLERYISESGMENCSGDYISCSDFGKVTCYYKDATKEPDVFDTEDDMFMEYEDVPTLALENGEYTTQDVDEYIAKYGETDNATVRLSFRGVSTTYTVKIEDRTYDHIKVVTPPTRVHYLHNRWDSIDCNGLVINAYDGADETTSNCKTYNYTECMKGDNPDYDYFRRAFYFSIGGHENLAYLELGSYDINAYLGSAKASFPINIIESYITDFTVTPGEDRNDTYLKGDFSEDGFSCRNLILNFKDQDGLAHSFATNSDEYYEWMNKYGMGFIDTDIPEITKAGDYTVKLSWLGATADYTIHIVDKLIEDMTILSYPTKRTYLAGADNSVSLSGLELQVTELDKITQTKYHYNYTDYDDLGSEYGDWDNFWDSDYCVTDSSNIDWSTPGEYEYTISYKGVTCAIPITVTENPIESITFTSMPNKTTYFQYNVNGSLNLSGASFTVMYKDHTTYTGHFEMAYEGENCTSMSVPYQGEYYRIACKKWKNVDSSSTEDYYGDYWEENMPAVGDNGIILTYMSQEVDVPITIAQNPVKSIVCVKNPDKMSYMDAYSSDQIDLYGAEFLVTYIDDTTYTLRGITHSDSIIGTDSYGGTITSYMNQGINGVPILHISYMNADGTVELDRFDYASESIGSLADESKYQISSEDGRDAQIRSFTPSADGYFNFYYAGQRDVDFTIVDDTGSNVVDEYDTLYDTSEESASMYRRYCHLTAGVTYYVIVTPGSRVTYDWDSMLYVSSTNSNFRLEQEKISDFEIIPVKDTWYDYESNIIHTYTVLEMKDSHYSFTYDGITIDGKFKYWNTTEDTCILYGNVVTARVKDTFYPTNEYDDEYPYVTISDDNAIIISYLGKETQIPLHFNVPTPVASMEVKTNPWADRAIYQFNSDDLLNEAPAPELIIHYNDGTADKTFSLNDEKTNNELDGCYFDMKYKNQNEDSFTGDIVNTLGENAVIVNYRGKTVEVPVTILPGPVTSISVVKKPVKDTYFADFQKLDLYGMELLIQYQDGSNKTVTVSEHQDSFTVDDGYQQTGTGSLNLWEEGGSIYIKYIGASASIVINKRFDIDEVQAALAIDTQENVVIDENTNYRIYSFTPSKTANYTLTSLATYEDPYAYLYSAKGEELGYNDDGETDRNFVLTRILTAGITYYYVIRYFDSDSTGNFDILLTQGGEAQPIEKEKISALNLRVTAPVVGETLETGEQIASDNDAAVDGYSITDYSWTPKADTAKGGTAYQLRLELTPDEAHEFETRIRPTVNTDKYFTRSLSSSGILTLYYTFPNTGCVVTVPSVEGYDLVGKNNNVVAYKGTISFGYTKKADNTSNEKLIVKANNKVLVPVDGVYTITGITTDMDVIVKTEAVSAAPTQSKLSLYSAGVLYDVLSAPLNGTVSQNDVEKELPILDSYQNGSDQFFFGWYNAADVSNNGTGTRFKSTTVVKDKALDLYAKWGKGMFSFSYNGLYANYKILSFDENNRMKIQLGDGKNPAVPTGMSNIAVDATGAGEDAGVLTIPDSFDPSTSEELAALNIDFGEADVVAIGANAFGGNTEITSVVLPDTVESIGTGAFKGCENLSEVTLPASIKTVESETFSGCKNLTEVTIPEGVTEIGASAFTDCSNLTTVVLPDTIETINEDAFTNTTETTAVPLKLVCSPIVVENTNVTEIAKTVGAKVETVDISFREINYDQLEFAMDDMPMFLTPVVTVDGENVTDRVVTVSASDVCRQYFTTGITDEGGLVYIQPLQATTEPQTVTVSASGVSKTLTLTATSVSLDEQVEEAVPRFTISDVSNQTYCGTAIQPKGFRVIDSEKDIDLQNGRDYQITYGTNINAGTGYIYINGIGSYTGQLIKTFSIGQASASITASDKSILLGTSGNVVGAAVTGKGSLSYASSDSSVVTVNQAGVLTPIRVGKATITITAPATTNYRAASKTITVTVNAPTLTLASAAYTKTYGDKAFALGASVDAGTLSYVSNKTNVAQVDAKGNVTVKGAGTATITVSAKDAANNIIASKTVTVTVNQAASKLKTKKSSYSVVYGAKAFSLGTTSNAGAKYATSNKKVATVSSAGKVTIKGCGKATITVTTTNANYKTAKKTVTVQVVPKAAKLSKVTNSASKQMTVKWSKQKEAAGYVIEYSTDKKFKKSVKSVAISKSSTTSTKIKKMTKGKTYYVRVKAYTKVGSKKVYGTVSKAKSVKIKK